MTRVAFFVDAWFPFVGGGQVHVSNLEKALFEYHNIASSVFAPKWTLLPVRAIWTLVFPIWFALILQPKHRFTLIHSHGFSSGLSAKIASKLTLLPVVHTVHGSHLMDLAKAGKRSLMPGKIIMTGLEKWLLTGIAYHAQITVASQFKQYKNVNKRIKVIPNGIWLSDFDAVEVEKYKRLTVLFVGRSHPHKGLKYLVAALKLINKNGTKVWLRKIDKGHLQGNKLGQTYKRAHIFVLPSLAEGQPITLLEAWAAKLPVVVTSVGENPKMVKHGETGLLVEPKDVDQLAKSIERLADNPQMRTKLGQAGYKQVKEHYTWQEISTQIVAVYRQVERKRRR